MRSRVGEVGWEVVFVRSADFITFMIVDGQITQLLVNFFILSY